MSAGGNGEAPTYTRKHFTSDQDVRWCPGCGDYAVLAQMQKVMPDLGIPREHVVFVSGIGCSSRFPYYMDTYGFHTIHGRAPAVATGIKLARPELSVWVVTGDGDALSIGGNHLIHALRRNVDIKILLFNNRVYGLTKGQFSPTSRVGQVTKTSPQGVIANPFSPPLLALSAGATFVARTVDTEIQHLQQMIRRMASHRGAAFLEIFQNCPVFNDGEFESLKDRNSKADELLVLQHGQRLVYGRDGDRVVKLNPATFGLYPGGLDDDDGGIELVHDEAADQPLLATLLARDPSEGLPMPIGVFRAADAPTFEDGVRGGGRREAAPAESGTLEQLLYTPDCWDV